MDEVSPLDVNGVWKMLDDMAISDPAGYQKFISDQMKRGSDLFSRPHCRGILKCTLKEGCPIFLNICEWQLIDPPKSKVSPIPIYCGSLYTVDGDKTACIAMHPVVFEQYGLIKTESKAQSDANQLIALVVKYISLEKGINTVESDGITNGSSVKFSADWRSKPHGSVTEMFASLNYNTFSFVDMSKQLLRATENSPSLMDEPNINLSPGRSNKSEKLIEEVKARPCWQLRQHRRKPNTHEYTITLPDGTSLANCELDISDVALSLKLKDNRDYPEAFCIQFAKPINAQSAKARYNKTTHCLSVTAPV